MAGKDRKRATKLPMPIASIIPRIRIVDAPVKSYPGLQAFLT